MEEAAGVADDGGVGQAGPARRDDGVGDVVRGRVLDAAARELGGEARVAGDDRAVRAELETHGRDDPVAALALEAAVAVAERAVVRGERPPASGRAVPRAHARDALGELHAVGADVLDRGGADGAGDQREVLEPAEAEREGPLDERVPADAGLGRDADGAARVRRRRRDGVADEADDEAGHVAPQHEVAAAAEHEHRPAGGVGAREEREQRGLVRRLGVALGAGGEPERVQRVERVVAEDEGRRGGRGLRGVRRRWAVSHGARDGRGPWIAAQGRSGDAAARATMSSAISRQASPVP